MNGTPERRPEAQTAATPESGRERPGAQPAEATGAALAASDRPGQAEAPPLDPLDRVDDPLIRLELERLREQREEHARRRGHRRPPGYWVARETIRYEPPRAAVWRSALVWLLVILLEQQIGSSDRGRLLACLEEDGYQLAELLLDWELRSDRYPELSDGDVRLLAGISALSLVDDAREQLETERR